MAYLHNNEYYTGYFAEGSSDYAGQQGPGYTRATIDPTTNSAKTVNIYFAEPVICESASGSFYKSSAPSYKTNINVQYRLSSTKAWTSTRPSEPIDAMILTNSQISGYSQGLSGFVWTFESKFTWGGEPDPEPEPDPDPTKYYYIKGTGSLNSCTSMGQTISGNVRFEAVFKLNGMHFVPWGICPDTGWGGSENADCRFTLTREPNWYFDYGSFRIGPVNASPFITALTQHRIKIEGSSTNITITDLDENTVLINQNISTTGTPNGPWMLGTTSNLQFYEGKVWNADTDKVLIDCKATQNGLYNKLTNTYYTLANVAYGNYDTVIPPVIYPDLTPQVDNYNHVYPRPLILRRRFGKFGNTARYERIAYIYLNTGTYYELDQLGTHYEAWNVDCVFQNKGVATGNGQDCWNWAIDVPTKRRLGCTFFVRYQSYTGDCNCGWADGRGHNADDGWLGGYTDNGTVQVYSSGAGWNNDVWYRGVSSGPNNSWTRYNRYVPSIENPYSGTYNGTSNPQRTFGSYTYANAENATAMTPFCLGDIRIYPGNTLSSFTSPTSQMFVYFAAWKLTINNQVIAEYLPVLVDGSIPCILNTVNKRIYYPHGVTPTYSMTF